VRRGIAPSVDELMDGLWNPLRPRQNCLLKRTVLVIDDTAIPKKVRIRWVSLRSMLRR
jgi:hypothetical protein